MSKKAKIIIVIAAVIVVICGAVGYYLYSTSGVTVETAQVSTEDFTVTVMASGSIKAGSNTDVYPEAQGVIKKLYVKDGDEVTKGDILAKLDADAMKAQLKQAQAGLAQAKQGLSSASSAGATKSASVSAANAAVSAAKTAASSATEIKGIAADSVKLAQKACDAAKALNPALLPPTTTKDAQIAAAKAQLNSAKSGYLQAKSGAAQAQAGVKQAQAGLVQAQSADVGVAKSAASAAVAAAQKQVDLAHKAVDKTTITAPATGTLTYSPSAASLQAAASGVSVETSLMKGGMVSPGAALFSIFNPKKMVFKTEVDEVDVAKIVIDQEAIVTLDAYPDTEFKGKVSKIGVKAQSTMTGGTIFLVEIKLDKTEESPKIGMKGDSTIQISTVPGVTTIPIEALFSEGGKDFVYVVTGGKLRKTDIETGGTTDTSVEITSGLTSGTDVALAGKTPYVDGMMVKIAAGK